MSPLDVAWFVLKSRPVSPSGREYTPMELQRLRSFVIANIDSPDPELRAQAQQIHDEVAAGISGAYGEEGPVMPGDQAQTAGSEDAASTAAPVALTPPVAVRPMEERETDEG